MHSATAGVERVLTPQALERGLLITNARGVFSEPIAEYVLMMVLAIARRLPQLLELQRERTWQPLEAREMRDITVGVVGLGSIGRAVAALASGFGCRVVATRRRMGEGFGAGLATTGSRCRASTRPARASCHLRRCRSCSPCDFVVLALPLTTETEDLIDDAAFARMKPGAWLINVARGRLVDERALLRALREGGSAAPSSTRSARSRCRPTRPSTVSPTSSSRRTRAGRAGACSTAASSCSATTCADSERASRS